MIELYIESIKTSIKLYQMKQSKPSFSPYPVLLGPLEKDLFLIFF